MASVRSRTFIGPMAASVRSRTFIGPMAPNTLVVEIILCDAVGDPSVAFTKNDIQKLFSEVGRLESVDLDSSNRFVVIFCRSKDAKEAMHKLNKTKLKGKLINITWCEKQRPCSNAKLSLSIHGVTTDDELKASFSAFGAVDSIKVVLQRPDTSYWTVQFDSEIPATNAIKFFNSAKNHGMKLLVSKYNDGKDLCVEYHPNDLDENNILRAFSKHGVCTVNIEKDKNCKSSGIGFVSYRTPEEAKEAMRNFNGAYLGSYRLYVRGIVMQATTEDNNPEEVPTFVTEDNNPEEALIFVIEANRRQLVTTVNMKEFDTIFDFFQSLNKIGDDHKHFGLVDTSRLDSPWPGYEVVYKHVDNKNEVVIKPFENADPFFNENAFKHSEMWFLSMVNKIEFFEKKGVPLVDLNA